MACPDSRLVLSSFQGESPFPSKDNASELSLNLTAQIHMFWKALCEETIINLLLLHTATKMQSSTTERALRHAKTPAAAKAKKKG